MWDTVNDIVTLAMNFSVIYPLIGVFGSVPFILASDTVLGAREEVSLVVIALVWVFFAGPFALAVHVGVFTVRYLRDKPRNTGVLVVSTALSVLLIPITLIFIFVMKDARYPLYPSMVLLIIELFFLGVQIFSWRFPDEQSTSPVPR